MGTLLVFLILLIIVSAGVFVLIKQRKLVELNPETMCPVDRKPLAYWSVLIDASDPLNPVQKQFVIKYLKSVREQIPKYGKFALYILSSPQEEQVSPVLALCNPGDGKGTSFIDQNPKLIRKRWQNSFAEPLDQTVKKMLHAPPSDISPIMEMITAVAVDAFPVNQSEYTEKGLNESQKKQRKEIISSVPSQCIKNKGKQNECEAKAIRVANSKVKHNKNLIVVSDMLQHSNIMSHYRYSKKNLFNLARGRVSKKMIVDLNGLNITILYLSRSDDVGGRVQGKQHILFWETLFERCDARLVEVQPVPGLE